ncbi:cell-cell signaling protein C-factor [Vibrio maritimus]|uniref:Cell-cell signaling protein C-factor n=1 Tax=Vibrio maritimus TaxID=990268 RepID=A0A090RYN1_9VIBR|nr:cell-cell signaling protein C-factor [Vibrio maritimus]
MTTNVLIVGGSGGIGWAMCRQLAQLPEIQVFATYRSTLPRGSEDYERISWFQLDVMEQAHYPMLVERLSEVVHLDWLINCVGALSINERMPEKSLKSVDSEQFIDAIRINTLPTLLLAQHFQPFLRKAHSPLFATISARVGSITDNGLGGWYSYRCSKAALNMALKNISIEWGRLMPRSCTVALHPGTTDTSLSKPFQARVPEHKLFSTDKTARLLIKVLQSLDRSNNGQFLAYDGSLIEW